MARETARSKAADLYAGNTGDEFDCAPVPQFDGAARSIILCREKLYLFAERGEAAGWVKNIRRSPNVSVRIREREIEAVAKVLDYRTDRQLWDKVQAIAEHKYGWGDGLPVEITPVARGELLTLLPKYGHLSNTEKEHD